MKMTYFLQCNFIMFSGSGLVGKFNKPSQQDIQNYYSNQVHDWVTNYVKNIWDSQLSAQYFFDKSPDPFY